MIYMDLLVLAYLFFTTGCHNYMTMTDEWIMNLYNNVSKENIKKLFQEW